ncbi:hypothetical protein J6590_075868 [Homalodisca vitripennis]|nr:hypothetical protein J6590_075868 [Homalodisca vitripennis]
MSFHLPIDRSMPHILCWSTQFEKDIISDSSLLAKRCALSPQPRYVRKAMWPKTLPSDVDSEVTGSILAPGARHFSVLSTLMRVTVLW